MEKILVIIFVCFLCGCSGIDYRTPNMVAHDDRNIEIEEAFASGDITKREYLEFKIENDKLLKSNTMRMRVSDY